MSTERSIAPIVDISSYEGCVGSRQSPRLELFFPKNMDDPNFYLEVGESEGRENESVWRIQYKRLSADHHAVTLLLDDKNASIDTQVQVFMDGQGVFQYSQVGVQVHMAREGLEIQDTLMKSWSWKGVQASFLLFSHPENGEYSLRGGWLNGDDRVHGQNPNRVPESRYVFVESDKGIGVRLVDTQSEEYSLNPSKEWYGHRNEVLLEVTANQNGLLAVNYGKSFGKRLARKVKVPSETGGALMNKHLKLITWCLDPLRVVTTWKEKDLIEEVLKFKKSLVVV